MASTSRPSQLEQSPVQVFCRILPIKEPMGINVIGNDITLLPLPNDPTLAKDVRYTFSRILEPTTTQEQVFQDVGLPLVQDVLLCKDSLLFAYGATGSGKTFTISGKQANPGIIQRTIDYIFENIPIQPFIADLKPDGKNSFDVQSNSRPNPTYQTLNGNQPTPNNQMSVFVSIWEIYNNYAFDLLEKIPVQPGKGNASKKLRLDVSKRVYLEGGIEIKVCSSKDAMDIFERGYKRRRLAATDFNARSSRSHTIFRIRVVKIPIKEGKICGDKEQIHVGQLSLVDLAGSERFSSSNNTRQVESGNINQSLTCLRKCLHLLRERQQTRNQICVPYAEYKLTYLMKSHFEGHGSVSMIICLKPSMKEYADNLATLQFAVKSREIKISKSPEDNLEQPASIQPPDIDLNADANNQNEEMDEMGLDNGVGDEELNSREKHRVEILEWLDATYALTDDQLERLPKFYVYTHYKLFCSFHGKTQLFPDFAFGKILRNKFLDVQFTQVGGLRSYSNLRLL